MKWLRVAVARIWALVFRRSVQRDIDEEIESHIEIATEWYLARGLSHDEARREVIRSFGSVVRIKEQAYEVRGAGLLGELMQDLKYAARMLKKYPGLTVIAVATLALGVGANTAIFSIVNAVLLRALPFPEPDRLVRIFFNNPGTGLHGVRFSVPELDDLRNRAGVFEQVSVFARGSVNLTGGSQPQRLEMLISSASYFSMLGTTPQIGRLFGPEDFTPGFAPSVVISDGLWRRNFASDPDVPGRTIHLDNDPYTIVGVLPPGFHHPGTARVQEIEVWLASGFSTDSDAKPKRNARFLPSALGRLKPGVTLAQAQEQLTSMADQLRHEYATDYPPEGRWTIEIQPLQESLVGDIRPMLLVLQGAVVLIVLIVSLNIANLLLARASGRQQEMAVRSALGASHSRLVRQMLTESLLLSFLGGAGGIVLAVTTSRFLLRFIPSTIPRINEIIINWEVLGFSLLISLLTGLLFGLAPAIHSTKADLSMAIREGSRGSGYSIKTGRLQDTLIVSELVIALILMIGAGLLLRTLQDLLKEDPGFNPTQVVAAKINLPAPNDPKLDPYLTIARQSSFYRELQRRMNAIPGVQLAAMVSDLPVAGITFNFPLSIEDRPSRSGDDLRADYERLPSLLVLELWLVWSFLHLLPQLWQVCSMECARMIRPFFLWRLCSCL